MAAKSRNYYEMLGLKPDCSQQEIQAAYDTSCKTFGGDSLATYSIFDDRQSASILEEASLAYKVLSNPQQRAEYDKSIKSALSNASEASQILSAWQKPPEKPTENPKYVEWLNSVSYFDGPMIGEARREAGYTIDLLATETKIRTVYIEALENENYKVFPGRVYLRGFVESVAKALGMPIKKTVDDYMQRYDNVYS